MPETQVLTIWLLSVDDLAQSTTSILLSSLDGDERNLASVLKNPDALKRFIASHALARQMVADLTGIRPANLVYQTDKNGCPAFGDTQTGVHFPISISRTEGLVACAFCPGVDFGVDIECLLPANADRQLVQSMFSKPEQALLEPLSGDQFIDAFFQVWTLKEAYVKAEGQGLSLPLDDFAFTLDPPDIHFLSEDARDKADWAFITLKPTGQHRLSAAVRIHGSTPTLALRHVSMSDLFFRTQ